MIIEKFLILIVLNMFVDEIPSTGIKFIKFLLQWWIIFDFWWNA